METACKQLMNFAPRLLIKGDIGGTVANVMVATEQQLVVAGSTIGENFDRLFTL